MTEETVRITADTAQAASAFEQFSNIVAKTNAQMETLNASTWRFQNISQTMNSSGQVIKTTATAISEEGHKVTTTINEMDSASRKGGQSMGYLGRELRNIGSAILIWESFRLVTQTIQDVIQAQAEYSISSTRFAIITGQSVDSAIADYNRLQSVTTAGGFKPSEAAPAIISAARFTKMPEDQAELVRTGTDLAKVLGIDVTEAVNILGSALRQTGKDMSEARGLTDLLLGAFVSSGGDIKNFTSALEEIPNVMSSLNMGFEQALGLVTGLSAATSTEPNTVANALVQMANGLQNLEGEKLFEVAQGFKELTGNKVDILDQNGELRNFVDILRDVQGVFGTLGSRKQQDLLELMMGGKAVRPQYRQVLIAALSEAGAGLIDGAGLVSADSVRASAMLDESFGQVLKVMDAKIEELQQRGGLLANVLTGVLAETIGKYGGRQGAQTVSGIASTLSITEGVQGQDVARTKLQEFIDQSGSPEEVRKKVAEYNKAVADAVNQEMRSQPLLAFLMPSIFSGQADALRIPDDMVDRAISSNRESISKIQNESFDKARQSPFLKSIFEGLGLPTDQFTTTPSAPAAPEATGGYVDPLLQKAQALANQQGGAQSVLGYNVTDVSKFSMEEVNAAMAESAAQEQQLQAFQREQLAALGLSKDQIDAIIAARQKELDLTVEILRTEDGLRVVRGQEAIHLQDALREKEKEKSSAESDFSFRRLKNVDPSQFGQLNALAQMYNQFLGSIGSPEKEKNINLLMGEDNVFKTMNVRMTALQMAMEDLTKTEKAQLSGTWNLPAGATAMVPISSLDIQRWNKGEGGGGVDALLAWLQAHPNGIGGGGGGTRAADQLTLGTQRVSRPTDADELDPYADIENVRLRRRRESMTPQEKLSAAQRDLSGYEDAGERARRLRGTSQAGGSIPKTLAPEVTINPMPLKASFNANINVMLNGAVLARALFQSMFNELLRLSRSGPGNTSNRGLGNVR